MTCGECMDEMWGKRMHADPNFPLPFALLLRYIRLTSARAHREGIFKVTVVQILATGLHFARLNQNGLFLRCKAPIAHAASATRSLEVITNCEMASRFERRSVLRSSIQHVRDMSELQVEVSR